MIDASECTSLPLHLLDRVLVTEHFESDRPIERGVEGREHHGVRAQPQRVREFVAAESHRRIDAIERVCRLGHARTCTARYRVALVIPRLTTLPAAIKRSNESFNFQRGPPSCARR